MSETGVVLYPNIDFLLKVNTLFHVTQPIEVLAMHGEGELGLHFLCVRRALKFYFIKMERAGDDIQLFLA